MSKTKREVFVDFTGRYHISDVVKEELIRFSYEKLIMVVDEFQNFVCDDLN